MTEKPMSPNAPGIVYEVNARLEPQLRQAYLDWLQPHIEKMLSFKGFRTATILTASESETSDQDKNLFHCTVNYQIDSADDLDHYLANHAATMRADGMARFGDTLQTSRRIFDTNASFENASFADHEFVHSGHESNTAADPVLGSCLNCGFALTGQYCHECGQREQRKLVSLTELIGDLVKDFTEWDSRFWRTLWPLLTKPGKLTVAYLEGRRMYYSPPLRMYLITSLLFFLIVSAQSQFSLMKMDITEPANDSVTLNFNGVKSSEDNTATPPKTDSKSATGEEVEAGEDVNSVLKKASENCAVFISEPGTRLEQIIMDRARQACLKITTREGLRNFMLDMIDNAPKTFILLLPLMALAHKLLYLSPRRFYVEHLLLFVHGYSFIFLFSSILIILSKISDAVGFTHFGWINLLSFFYMAYYFLKSMRVVYQQSRGVTVFKWLLSMFVFVGLVVFVFMLYTAMTAILIT